MSLLLVGVGWLSAWIGADHSAWYLGLLAAVVTPLGLLGLSKERPGYARRWLPFGERSDRVAFAFAVLACVAWVYEGLAFKRSVVHIENATARTVDVEWAGGPRLEIAPGQLTWVKLPRRSHGLIVRAKANGEVLHEMTVDVRRGAYVLNVLGGQRYYKGTLEYVPEGRGGPDSGLSGWSTTRDVWIEADFDYVLRKPPPKISIPEGFSPVIKTFLLHESDLL